MKFGEMVTLTGIFIFSPRNFLPTLRAPKNTRKNCNVRYGELHHSNDRTNAYRHALWNLLICEECFKVTGNVEKAVNWAGKITDLHEELSPNLSLEKAMGLHNNRIGREIFKESIFDKKNSGELLDKKMGEAVKIDNIIELQNWENHLVFIESCEN